MIMASIAAAIWALANVLAGIAFATFSGPLDTSTFSNLATASGWLTFSSALVALGATCFVAWSLYLARQWTQLWEVGGASLSTLLLAIGLLVLAAQSHNSTSNAGNVVAAIGLGGWAIVIVVGAARHALLEQENAGLTHQATLRLGAAGAVVLIAVSVGLPNPTINDASVAIATGALLAVGFAGLLVVISLARPESHHNSTGSDDPIGSRHLRSCGGSPCSRLRRCVRSSSLFATWISDRAFHSVVYRGIGSSRARMGRRRAPRGTARYSVATTRWSNGVAAGLDVGALITNCAAFMAVRPNPSTRSSLVGWCLLD